MRLHFAAAVLALAPAIVCAQGVRGTIVTREGTMGVPGVVVLLVNRGDSVVSRALTNERGQYRLTANSAGSFRIRTLRLGYRPGMSDAFSLAVGQELSKTIALTGVTFSLDTVRVLGRNACHAVRDSAAATFAVWEQVRTALTATQLSASERTISATTLNYRRMLDKNLSRVRRQSSTLSSRLVTQPWVSMSPDSLRRFGYVLNDGDSTTYYGPGIEVLLSDAFLEDHCFRLTASPDASRIGIAFEPVAERTKLADIRGTLWIDRASSELRSLEFRYVNLLREQEQRAGGDVAFVRMASGAWAVSRWNIRMPVMSQRRSPSGSPGGEIIVIETAIEGGELVLATRGRDTLWSRAPMVLAGVVTDSVTEAPVAGAKIVLVGTSLSATSDSSGHFHIDEILPGEYVAEVHTKALDAIGAVVQSVITFTDSVSLLRVHTPTHDQLGGKLCGVSTGLRQGIVIGTVAFRGDTSGRKGLSVRAVWNENNRDQILDPTQVSIGADKKGSLEASISGGSTRQRQTVTDDQGRFRICGVPLGTPLVVEADVETSSAEPVMTQITDGLFTRVDLVVDRLAARGATFAGLVVADSTNAPVAGAEVSLPALGLAERTDDRGAFRFNEIPAGSHQLLVRRLGFGSLDTKVDFAGNTTVTRRIVLSRTVVLDSVHVTANATSIPSFDEHRALGLGHFMTRAQLATVEGVSLAALIEQMPAVHIVRGKASHSWLTKGRGLHSHSICPDKADRAMGAGCQCYALVYLDRTLVYHGRESEPLFDLNTISPAGIEAIEYYSGGAETPLEYSADDTTCGVVVIWTRRSDG
jgi:hypothetical protein